MYFMRQKKKLLTSKLHNHYLKYYVITSIYECLKTSHSRLVLLFSTYGLNLNTNPILYFFLPLYSVSLMSMIFMPIQIWTAFKFLCFEPYQRWDSLGVCCHQRWRRGSGQQWPQWEYQILWLAVQRAEWLGRTSQLLSVPAWQCHHGGHGQFSLVTEQNQTNELDLAQNIWLVHLH